MYYYIDRGILQKQQRTLQDCITIMQDTMIRA